MATASGSGKNYTDEELYEAAKCSGNKRTRQEFEPENLCLRDADIRFEMIKKTFDMFRHNSHETMLHPNEKMAIHNALMAHINLFTHQISDEFESGFEQEPLIRPAATARVALYKDTRP